MTPPPCIYQRGPYDLEFYADQWEQEQSWREEYERDQLANPEPAVMLEDWPLIAPPPAAPIPSDLPF